ncbi:acetyltransferase [Vreelandella venusta]|uniref:acetyltransferase n=1 Tax=Vreelandella venusta TaxID=44935 RepID=UPI00384C7C55
MSANSASAANRGVILLGGGGHAKVLLDALRLAGVQVRGVVDPVLAGTCKLWRGIPVIGNDDDLLKLNPDQVILVNGTGSLPSKLLRQRLFSRFTEAGFQFMNVIHPSALIGAGVELGVGVQIMAGAIIQADTTVGDNSIINTGVLVDHDCAIGCDVHLAPGVVVSGGVSIGEGAHVGTGSSIIQGISIGAGAIVGAGTVVVKDVPNHHKLLSQAPRPLIKLDLE